MISITALMDICVSPHNLQLGNLLEVSYNMKSCGLFSLADTRDIVALPAGIATINGSEKKPISR